MLEDYRKRVEFLDEKIAELAKVLNGNDRFLEELDYLRQRVEAGTLNIAVLGQFKRGKTSLINALIGEDLLPTSVIPLTSIITVLKYGSKSQVKVIFSGKREKRIGMKDIWMYVTGKGNPSNEKGVLLVEIEYPSDYLKNGIVLIDTPGVGSTFLHNTEVTYSYLGKIDVGIFLLSADPPVSHAELQFLKEVKSKIPVIFFILNKTDYLDDQQVKEVSEFNRSIMEKELGDRISIYPFSAKLALEGRIGKGRKLLKESGLEEFDKILSEFFAKEKGRVLALSIKNSLLRLIGNAIMHLELQRNSITTPLEELESKLEEFGKGVERIKTEQTDAEPVIKSEIGKIMEAVDEDLDSFKKQQEPLLLMALESRFREKGRLSKKELITEMEGYYAHATQEIFDLWRAKEEEMVRERFERIVSKFSSETNNVIERIKSLSSKIFKIKASHVETKDAFSLESSLYYKTERIFISFGDEAKFILPGFAFKKLLWKELKRSALENIDMNCGRVRYDFLERLNKSCTKFLGQLDKKVDSTIKSITDSIEVGKKEAMKGKREAMKKISEIECKLERLGKISAGLNALKQ